MIIETDDGDVNLRHLERCHTRMLTPDEFDALMTAAQQADAYLRHCRDTSNAVNLDAVPLLRLRAELDRLAE